MTEDAAGSTNETTDSPQGPQHAAPQALQVGTWAPPTVATVLAVTLGLAAASWVLAIRLMRGMDPGVAPRSARSRSSWPCGSRVTMGAAVGGPPYGRSS
jgi:hypothetical protein